jgi:hypothetical protein
MAKVLMFQIATTTILHDQLKSDRLKPANKIGIKCLLQFGEKYCLHFCGSNSNI